MTLSSKTGKLIALAAIMGIISLGLANDSWARAGGGRTSGSAGSRSSSTLGSSGATATRPTAPTQQAAPAQQPSATAARPATPPPPPPAPTSGGFMRGLAGGLAGGLIGGMIGNMLFGGSGHAAGGGGFGGGGIGLFDILLIGLGLYLLYRFVIKRKKQEAAAQSTYQASGFQQPADAGYAYQGDADAGQSYGAPPPPPPPPAAASDTEQGLTHIRAMDGAFDLRAFLDGVTDIFFQVQAAWSKRALEGVRGLLTEEMFGVFSGQVQEMMTQGRTNRLENVSVRSAEVTEAWQEQGQDYITVRFYANLLDYTTDDKSGQVVQGSDKEPVKFDEYWTFTRPVGPNPWRLTAVTQVN